MRKFCPACGSEGELTEGLCNSCRSKKEKPAGGSVHAIVCSTCNKTFEKGMWKRFEKLESLLSGKAGMRGHARYIPHKKELVVESDVVHRFKVSFEKRQCPECEKKAGRGYEGVLQVRGKRDLKFLRECEGIVNIEEKKEGIDVFFTTKGSARTAAAKAKKDGAIIKETHKLVTKHAGIRSSRITILARF